MIKNFFTILFLLFSVPSFAATQQVIATGTDDNIDTTATEYFPLGSVGTELWSGTEYTVVWPASGTIEDLFVELDASPGAGNTSQWTIRVNKATPGTPTQASCANATACNDTTNATAITVGDEASIMHVQISTPTTSDPTWSISWNPTTPDNTVIVGSSMANTLATSGTQYLPMHGMGTPVSASFDVSTFFPTGGILRDLYIELGTDPGDGTSRTFAFGTVDCTVTGSAGGTNKTCNSGSDTQAVSANDTYTLTSTVSGIPAASIISYGVVFVPTTSGEFTFHGSSYDDLSNNNEFNWMTGAMSTGGDWSGTTDIRENLSGVAFTIKNIYFEVETDPGPDTDLYNIYFRVDGTNSALTCQLTGTGAGPWRCNASSNIAVSSGNELSVAVTDDGTTPATTDNRWALTGFITPTGEAARRIISIQ